MSAGAVTVTIERLGHLGDGRAGGYFVPGALPGEVVEGVPDAKGRIAAPRILTPSPDRVRPPCAFARRCGGCLVQHAREGLVAEWKAGIVAEALAQQGLDAPLRPILTVPMGSRRRARLTGRRLKAGPVIGFHAHHSPDLVAVERCLVLHPALNAAWPALRDLVGQAGSRQAELHLQVTESLSGLDVAVEGAPRPGAEKAAMLAALTGAAGWARLSWAGEVLAQVTPPRLRFGKAEVALPPGAFLQATAEGEAALSAAALEALGGAARVVELFAGIGSFTFPLAERAEVWALEGEAEAVAALAAAARQTPGLKPIRAEARDLFRRPVEGEELKGFDAALLDPPRAGAAAQCAALAARGLRRVAYLSCNPVSFARDAAVLVAGGFHLDWVQPIDQFRGAAHVELAAQFSR